MDNTNSRLGDVAKELREIKHQLLELNKQISVNTHILNEHHKRSTMLEERMSPLEDDYKYRHKLYGMVMGSSGVLAIVGLIISLFNLLKK